MVSKDQEKRVTGDDCVAVWRHVTLTTQGEAGGMLWFDLEAVLTTRAGLRNEARLQSGLERLWGSGGPGESLDHRNMLCICN